MKYRVSDFRNGVKYKVLHVLSHSISTHYILIQYQLHLHPIQSHQLPKTFAMSPYTSSTPISDLVDDYAPIIKGKTILTTGVTLKGLGAAFVEAAAAASPELLILAGRNASKLRELSESIVAAHPGVKTRHLVVDLSSMDSVRRAAEEVNDGWGDVPKIDVVVNNAGVMAIPYSVTADGFEMQFAADHLGHFLLTNLIMEKILASECPRVVNVSSNGHSFSPVRFYDPHFSVRQPPLIQYIHVAKNFDDRRARHITDGRHTGRQRRQTCSSRCPWPRSWEAEVSRRTACTRASS